MHGEYVVKSIRISSVHNIERKHVNGEGHDLKVFNINNVKTIINSGRRKKDCFHCRSKKQFQF